MKLFRSAVDSTVDSTLDALVQDERVLAEEKNFLQRVIRPELTALKPADAQIILDRFGVIVDNRNKYSSAIPVGEYDRELVSVAGIKRLTSPAEMARLLALGVITRKADVLKRAEQYFQPEILAEIRRQANQKGIFNQVGRHLVEKELTEEQAVEILSALRNPANGNNNTLSAMVDFIEKGLINSGVFSSAYSLVARVNMPRIDYTRDMGKSGSCAFWGTGEGSHNAHYQKDPHSRYHASQLYMADPDLGLLVLQPEVAGKLQHPTGLVIMAALDGEEVTLSDKAKSFFYGKEMYGYDPLTCESGRNGTCLLIDSIEAYRPDWDKRFADDEQPLRGMDHTIWKRLLHHGILRVADTMDVAAIFYNSHFFNQGGNVFTSYFLEQLKHEGYQVEEKTMRFRKTDGGSYIPKKFANNFGYFLDTFLPPEGEDLKQKGRSGHFENADSYHASRGVTAEEMEERVVKGYVIRKPESGWLNPGLKIRDAAIEDIDTLMALEQRIFREDSCTRSTMKDLIAGNNRTKIFIAEQDGNVVGYSAAGLRTAYQALKGKITPVEKAGIMLSEDSPVGLLLSVAVENKPEIRGRGIGRHLVEARLRWLKQQGVEHVFAHAIPKPRGGFPYLAEKLNFTAVPAWDGRVFSDGTQAVLYYKRI